jgi:hypothetical protein
MPAQLSGIVGRAVVGGQLERACVPARNARIDDNLHTVALFHVSALDSGSAVAAIRGPNECMHQIMHATPRKTPAVHEVGRGRKKAAVVVLLCWLNACGIRGTCPRQRDH